MIGNLFERREAPDHHTRLSTIQSGSSVLSIICTPEQLPLVAKLNWHRLNEAEIIKRARETPNLSDYLPYVVGCMDSIGHYLLCVNGTGIRHLDLSLANLVFRVRIIKGKQKYFGVLNDWDLGDLQESRPKSHKDLSIIMATRASLLSVYCGSHHPKHKSYSGTLITSNRFYES
ncbi:hypothetical protein RSAG8_06879, partial [Rhizoctonia solani AG-8 WAC10335]